MREESRTKRRSWNTRAVARRVSTSLTLRCAPSATADPDRWGPAAPIGLPRTPQPSPSGRRSTLRQAAAGRRARSLRSALGFGRCAPCGRVRLARRSPCPLTRPSQAQGVCRDRAHAAQVDRLRGRRRSCASPRAGLRCGPSPTASAAALRNIRAAVTPLRCALSLAPTPRVLRCAPSSLHCERGPPLAKLAIAPA